MTCAFVNPPPTYSALLIGLPDDLTIRDALDRALDFVHFFPRDRKDLVAGLDELRSAIARDGMIWVSWPKQSSGVRTDLTESVVRRAGLAAGLVDVKVCAVDETWSALKFVIRVADRR